MSQPLEYMAPSSAVWCGRSWEGLVDRRYEAFQHALALRNATDANSPELVSEFFAFFDDTGIGLFRDEEEWIFRTWRPTPHVVVRALKDHIEISELITALLNEADAGCLDLRVIHRLGELLASHLLFEEEEIRPLLRRTDPVLLPV